MSASNNLETYFTTVCNKIRKKLPPIQLDLTTLSACNEVMQEHIGKTLSQKTYNSIAYTAEKLYVFFTVQIPAPYNEFHLMYVEQINQYQVFKPADISIIQSGDSVYVWNGSNAVVDLYTIYGSVSNPVLDNNTYDQGRLNANSGKWFSASGAIKWHYNNDKFANYQTQSSPIPARNIPSVLENL